MKAAAGRGPSGGLILDASQGLVAAEHRHDVKHRRGHGPARQGRPERLGDLAELPPGGRSAKALMAVSRAGSAANPLPGKLGPDLPEQGPRLAIEQLFCLVVDRQRSLATRQKAPSMRSSSVFARGLSAGKGSRPAGPSRRRRTGLCARRRLGPCASKSLIRSISSGSLACRM